MTFRQNFGMVQGAWMAANTGNHQLAKELLDKIDRWFWWVCMVPYAVFVGVVFVWAIGFRVFGWW